MSSEQKPLSSTPSAPLNPESGGGSRDGTLAMGPALAGIAAVVGALCVWALIQAFYPVFLVPTELLSLGPFATAEQSAARDAAIAKAELDNAMLTLACSGAVLGAALGLAEGLARRSIGVLVLGGVGCAVIAALFGPLAAWLGILTGNAVRPVTGPMPLYGTVAFQGVALGTLGLGVGLGLGILTGRVQGFFAALFGGLLAGAVAGMVFPLPLAFLPLVQTDRIIPMELLSRLEWIGLFAILLGLVLTGLKPKR